ncbi:alpha/beta fold hydrolase [Bradyrhizobium mercantei]|uniref:alpha/beta fold hydrolase n=1 Tax=Bradyrhizobium mercantei TaxID=1904807 RepID=UPI0009782270|nr:alpha/beta hydrolase [Bradyrhizobium mercantei]
MLVLIVVLAVAGLALATQLGVQLIQRAFQPQGRMIDVAGARLHVVELGPRDAAGPPIVLLHGASSNLRAMQPLGERIAKTHRVILIDRPGHGWSTRERVADSTPAIQGRMIADALTKIGVERAIVVAHSWAGALALRIALDHPDRVAGLVLLAPVAYPWRGGAGRYNDVIATPLIGPLLAYTITLPLGYLVAGSGARGVFAPQPMPDDFVRDSATLLLLRPREFIANARDLVTLKAAVIEQAPRYAEITAPVSIISGDVDKTVSTGIHSRPLAATAPNARLIVLPGTGHMVQYAAPDLVASEIEAMAERMARHSAMAD